MLLFNCSASYEELTKLNTKDPNNFQEYLINEYKIKAIYEAEEMHDWNSTKLYSEKALKALEGKSIYPEKTSYWKIPNEIFREIKIANENLMSIYDNAKFVDPYNLAKAIVSLDCWSEQQEENWQTWDINKCKDDFLSSMHIIYKKIAEQKENKKGLKNKKEITSKDKATIVTTDKDNELLHIIYFDFDKTKLSETSINSIKDFLKKHESEIDEYLIVGHTDTKGTNNYNYTLSIKRAEVVQNLLIKNNIQESKIKILGKGEESPAILTPDNTKHPANRRVEIKKSN